MVQEVGFAKLQALGIKLIAADSPHSFLDDTPTSKLIRQILGAVSEFDRAMVVAKLKGARERKRLITGKKVEGRKSHAELHPEVVALVRQLRRRRHPIHPALARALQAGPVVGMAHLITRLGLDHFEGRSWHSLHRHALMTMIAYAFLQHRRLAKVRRGKKDQRPAASTDVAGSPVRHRRSHHAIKPPAMSGRPNPDRHATAA
jgi:hypothetical protein